MQHNNVMLKGNGFYELGIQPLLNAFSFCVTAVTIDSPSLSVPSIPTLLPASQFP